ncbi:MAG TPA: hypothetical protein V6C90_26560 [Coleofasciculaceae cyanobacterium]
MSFRDRRSPIAPIRRCDRLFETQRLSYPFFIKMSELSVQDLRKFAFEPPLVGTLLPLLVST